VDVQAGLLVPAVPGCGLLLAGEPLPGGLPCDLQRGAGSPKPASVRAGRVRAVRGECPDLPGHSRLPGR